MEHVDVTRLVDEKDAYLSGRELLQHVRIPVVGLSIGPSYRNFHLVNMSCHYMRFCGDHQECKRIAAFYRRIAHFGDRHREFLLHLLQDANGKKFLGIL